MTQFIDGFALLIGVDENSVPNWALPAVAKDIIAVQQVLTHPDRCAYLPEHMKVITGEDATRQGILDGLDWLQEQLRADAGGNATAIIHYSGHGWRDETVQPPAYYLVPYDVRQDNLRSRALRAEDFADAIHALTPRRLLVIFDCCHAGGMNVRDIQPGVNFLESAIPPRLFMVGERAVDAAEGIEVLNALAQGHGRAVLSSSQGEQPSYNRRDEKMGIFTYHLIEALTGHAQPQEGASEVLVSDIMSYVWRHVPYSAQADWGQEQQPEYQVSGNFPVALLLGGRGLAVGENPPDPAVALPAVEPDTSYSVSTGGGDFVGRDQFVSGDLVQGDRVGGDSISVGNISNSGVAIGRHARVTMRGAVSTAELDKLFAPIYLALRDAHSEKEAEALQKAEALQGEVAKGDQADDNRMARLVDRLLDLVPGVVSAVVSVFATPVLAGIAGPLTKFVLEKFRQSE